MIHWISTVSTGFPLSEFGFNWISLDFHCLSLDFHCLSLPFIFDPLLVFGLICWSTGFSIWLFWGVSVVFRNISVGGWPVPSKIRNEWLNYAHTGFRKWFCHYVGLNSAHTGFTRLPFRLYMYVGGLSIYVTQYLYMPLISIYIYGSLIVSLRANI